MNRIKLLIALADLLWTLRKSIKEYCYIKRTETAKRAAIQLNQELDLAAIQRAGDLVKARIDAGYYSHYTAVVPDLNAEIEIQKVLIRQEL